MINKRKILSEIYIEPRTVVTEKGPIEFDLSGTQGPVILSVHGGIGGLDQARLITNWLDNNSYRLLCPSRPGYLGTPLKSGKTFEAQADLLAALLDHLQIESVGVVCLSAGGPPAYQFAIRHPERIWGLVAIDSVSGIYYPPTGVGPMTEAIFMSNAGQRFSQMLMERFPKLLLGEAFRGIGYFTKEQAKRQVEHVLNEPQALAWMKALLETMYPYSKRKQGNINDMEEFLKSTHLQLEQIQCPSLIIHGTHDADVKFFDGVYAYEHIPGAVRYWIEEGDHTGFWLSQHAEQAQEYARAFLKKHAPDEL
ncbi:alpha/beta hydrolase [Ktedonosporobacter rubrisoli]|uniref:Alpha/beta hydrolase n=1 Tax=Ktedonosporobacter rubrisoli TaxID=2509675 RepID=A0A4V0YY20_KTERU|nr:alpha/beta hydrolase [Ktedonosporobacter rubrisoli]QBD74691.1 alpha/beta hydrolase [Ktedonosporobacter rubrisoli]